jgi:hypothetical protein
MTEAEKKPSTLAVATGRWRDKLLDAAIITIPTALVTQSVNWVQGEFFAQPWQIVWVALPLGTPPRLAVWRVPRLLRDCVRTGERQRPARVETRPDR